jgi:hypothetical protein
MVIRATGQSDRPVERIGWMLPGRSHIAQAISRLWKHDGEVLMQWILIIGFFGAVVGAEKIFGHSSASCWVNSAAPLANADWNARMTVKHGTLCPVWVKTAAADINELKIISPPAEGKRHSARPNRRDLSPRARHPW